MIRLRLPTDSSAPAPRLPAALRWDAPTGGAIRFLLGRRRFLQATFLALGLLVLPMRGTERALARSRGRFLVRRERKALIALCDRILPPDGDPGAAALGAPRYILRLLTALDRPKRPRIFAGGPFSGRHPFADERDGTPGRRRPRNDFKRPLRLSRLQELAWRAELFGSAAVPEVQALDEQFGGPLLGLRDVYRAGLAKTDEVAVAMAGAPFAELTTAQQDEILALLDDGAFPPDPRRGNRTFIDLLIGHTLEGCFGAPEYGGNRKRRGWAMLGLQGDVQPLGYSLYSAAADDYVERPDLPMSTPNPDEVAADGTLQPRPLTADGAAMQEAIASLTSIFADGRC
jgi:hypothetical protein